MVWEYDGMGVSRIPTCSHTHTHTHTHTHMYTHTYARTHTHVHTHTHTHTHIHTHVHAHTHTRTHTCAHTHTHTTYICITSGVSVTLTNLGKVYHELGYLTDSLLALQRSQEITETLYSVIPNHPQVYCIEWE